MGSHGLLHRSKYLEFDGKGKESLSFSLSVSVVESKVILEGLQRYGPTPIYLPVSYQILNAESAFFLQEANQDLMRNSSLQARTESFFIHQARQMPLVNASYGPLSVQQPVPLELLQTLPGERIHPSWPKVQVLFYIAGRDWDDYSAIHKLPCVRMFAFHETQEVRGTCRLKGELGLCVAELEPLASWFSLPTVRPGRQRVSEQAQGTPVELYYMVQTTDNGDCSSEDSRKGSSVRTDQQRPMGYFAGHTPMQRIGSVRLFQPLSELKLDNNFVVMAPSKPILLPLPFLSFTSSILLLLSHPLYTLSPPPYSVLLSFRLCLSDCYLPIILHHPLLSKSTPDTHLLPLSCCRVEAAGYQRVLQVDLEVNGLMVTQGGREVTWQVEYPLTRTLTSEVQTRIRLAPQDLGGIVPLAMDTEILNTAVLNGRTVAMPVKVVTVGTDGAVSDVTESVECKSTDEQVIKVSGRCDYVYVNGKETRGKSRVMLNFTYSFLSAQLEMSVWMPRLPLLIDVADPELSQIKGWRVPLCSHCSFRYERVTDDKDDGDQADERTENVCAPQYQSTTLRVLTHFIADTGEVRGAAEEDGLGQQNFLLGSDWQVEVTQLVKDSLRVEDPKVAQLLEGQVLIGLSAGTTKLQVVVLSPLTSSVLAERRIRVLDDKVSVTELGVQLVSGLSLSLQLSPGSNRAIVATATTQEVSESLKQESLISAWLQFSDGSMTPLDNYNPAHFTLAATSLDEQVVAVQRSPTWKWPIIVAKGEGQGLLVRVEMSPSEVCQKGKRRTVLATGMANVQVRFSQPEEQYRQPGDRGHVPVRPNGGEFSEYPDQAELPRSRSTDEDLLPSRRGLTDLEIGMYALLGVFCLAILVFLINCISYAYKYRSKHLSLEAPEAMPHAHDWVWLGQEEGLCLQQQQQDELSGTLEEGSQLLNGGVQRGNTGVGGCSSSGRDHRNESLNSPTTKRKRVKFTTFSNVKSSNGCPVLSPLALVQTSEIKWVCPDIELGDSKDLRNYMEKLNENAIKNIA
uniref:Transmembrane protein 132C n=1 Tax=Seriola dumerili TaxID=41447 RepID=A0A3B4TVM4_SERDU